MRIKKGFMLVPVQGNTMAVSTGELEKTFPGMIKMNETCADIWRLVDEGKELDQIIDEYAELYGIDHELASTDVNAIVDQMRSSGIIED